MIKGLRKIVLEEMRKLKPTADENDLKICFGNLLDRECYEDYLTVIKKWFEWDKTASADEKKRLASMSHDNIMLAAIQLGYTKLYPELVMYE